GTVRSPASSAKRNKASRPAPANGVAGAAATAAPMTGARGIPARAGAAGGTPAPGPEGAPARAALTRGRVGRARGGTARGGRARVERTRAGPAPTTSPRHPSDRADRAPMTWFPNRVDPPPLDPVRAGRAPDWTAARHDRRGRTTPYADSPVHPVLISA